MYYPDKAELSRINKSVVNSISEKSVKIESDSASLEDSSNDGEEKSNRLWRFEEMTGRFDSNYTESNFS